jgi:hypothetical protein
MAVFGKDYSIRLTLLDSAGREVQRLEETCDVCTVKEAEDAVTRAGVKVAALVRATPAAASAPPPPPPPKAAEPVPPPPKPAAPPPPKPAAPPPPAPAAAPPGATTAAPVTTRPAERRGFPWRATAIASTVIGVVGLAIGIPLLVIDGEPTCDVPNPQKNCPEVWNTAGGGAAVLTLGVGGLAAAGVLFYLDYRSRHRPGTPAAVSVVPIAGGGGMVMAGGRF